MMREKNQIHWVLLEIAEQEASSSSIDLWSRIEAEGAFPAAKTSRVMGGKKQAVFLLVLALLLLSSLFFVPAVRAFAEDIIQRMGIAFVDTNQVDQTVQVVKVEATYAPPPPSLSAEEVRAQVAFRLLLPAWLPDGLVNIHRSIREYDPASWEGSGKKVTIAYSLTPDFRPENGVLFLHANDGSIGAPPLLAESRRQMVEVNGQAGIYVHGGWRDDGRGDPDTRMGILQWDDEADDAYLTWTQEGVTYLLEAHNLGLELEDLEQIAGSMKEE